MPSQPLRTLAHLCEPFPAALCAELQRELNHSAGACQLPQHLRQLRGPAASAGCCRCLHLSHAKGESNAQP